MKKAIGLFDYSTLIHTLRHSTSSVNYGQSIIDTYKRMKQNLGLDMLIFVQDQGKSRFRYDLFPEYKAHRKAKELTEAEKASLAEMQIWNKNLKLFNDVIPSNRIQGVEADDLICMLYHLLKDEYEIVPITVDKDFLSAIPASRIYNWKKSRYFSKEEDAYGFSPNKFLLSQALRGDSSDNIKGICGEKTAIILMNNFDNFKQIRDFEGELDTLDGITRYNKHHIKKAIELLKTDEGWERLKLSYQLVKIFRDTKSCNEEEIQKYEEVVDMVKTWQPAEEISEDLEMFLWENDSGDLLLELEALL